MGDELIKGKSKQDLLNDITIVDNKLVTEQRKMAVFVKQIEELEISIDNLKNSMNENALSSNKLSIRVFWLNIVIAIATIAGVVIAYFSLIKQ